MNNTHSNSANQIGLLPSFVEGKQIEKLSRRLIVLKYMLGILMCTFVAIVTEII